jgi:twitching motility protein PilT
MVLMDDSLFGLWRQGLVEKEDAIRKASKALELRQRIELAEQGRLEDEEEEDEDEEDDDDEEDEEEEEEEQSRRKGRR